MDKRDYCIFILLVWWVQMAFYKFNSNSLITSEDEIFVYWPFILSSMNSVLHPNVYFLKSISLLLQERATIKYLFICPFLYLMIS